MDVPKHSEYEKINWLEKLLKADLKSDYLV